MTVDRSLTIRLRVASEQFDAAMAKAGTEVRALATEVNAAGNAAGLTKLEAASNKLADATAKVTKGERELSALRKQEEAITQKLADAEAKRQQGLAKYDLGPQLVAAKMRKAAEQEQLALAPKIQKAEEDLAKAKRDTTAAALKFNEVIQKTETVAKHATDTGIKPLADAIIMLGPALVPIAGAAVTLGAGLLGLGATGILAFKGIQQEIAQNTALGKQYSAGLSVLANDLNTLQGVAAKGVLTGFNRAVADAQTQMPQLTRLIGSLSGVLGDVAANTLHGVIGGFQTFEPLIQHVSLYIDQLSARFAAWATGPGGAHFGQTLGAEFDKVMPVLENLIGAVGKLIAAFAPVGNEIVGVIGSLASAINAVPLSVLQALATAFTALYTANRLRTMFDGLSGSLANFSAKAAAGGKAGSALAGSMSEIAGKAGGYAAAAFLLIEAGQKYSDWSQTFQQNHPGGFLAGLLGTGGPGKALGDLGTYGAALGTLTDALRLSNGAVDDGVRSAISYQLAQTGIAEKAAKAGVSTAQLTRGITGTAQQFDALVAAWKAGGDPSGKTIGQLGQMYSAFHDVQTGTTVAAAAQPNLWRELSTTTESLKQVADKYHLTATQAQKYAVMMGISKDAIANGVVNNGQLADAVAKVAKAYDGATASGDLFLDALQKFASSDGGTADRAALIGATLKAANGDALGYADSMVKAATANQSFVTAFDNARTAAKAAGVAFDNAKTGVVDLTAGTINYSNAAAGPLIQNLQSMQDAAMKAAGATYQHEAATNKAKAANDAFNIYVAQTHGALIAEAEQLGLTKEQAGKLADQYFGIKNIGEIKTKITAIGTDPIVTVLNKIGEQLGFLSGHPWSATVSANTAPARKDLSDLGAVLDSLTTPRTVTVTAVGSGLTAPGLPALPNLGGPVHPYIGGLIRGPGTGTSDSIPAMVSNGEYVVNAAATARNKGLLDAINGSANVHHFAGGGFVGVVAPTPKPAPGAGAAKAASNQAQATLNAQGAIQFTVENSDLPKFLQSIKGTAAQINAAMTKLIADVHNAALKGLGSGSIIPTLQAETSRLEALANRRVAIASQLRTANTNLTAAWKLYNDEAAKVSTTVMGSFDISQAGNNGGYSNIDRIIADEKQKVVAADRFGAEIKKLSAMGLNKQLIQDLAEKGPQGAGVNVDALAAGSVSQIAQVNALYAHMGASSNGVGHVVADSLYGAGVNSAKHLIAGLASQETAIKKQMGHLAGVMAKQLEKDLHLSNAFLDAVIKAVSQSTAKGMR